MTDQPWKPVEKPYRVSWCFRHQTLNWQVKSEVYSTLEEATAEFDKPANIRGLISVEIHQAMNPETWTVNGRWKSVAKRKPFNKKAKKS